MKREPVMRWEKWYGRIKLFFLFLAIANSENIGAPLLVTKDGVILDGHTRLRIAKSMGIEKVSVVAIDAEIQYMSPDELIKTY